MSLRDPGGAAAPAGMFARVAFWVTDEALCVASALGAVAGGVGLATAPELSGAVRLVGVGLLAYLVVGLYTLSVYLQRRRPEILGVLAGDRPLTPPGKVLAEVHRLALVQLASVLVDGLKIGLAMLCFTAFVLDNLLSALGLFSLCVFLVCKLDALGAYLRDKIERFYAWDGVVVVARADGPGTGYGPGPAGAARWLSSADRLLDWFLFPPVSWVEPEFLELVESRLEVDPALPCRVCGEPLGGQPVVVCGSCATPHHADCFEYVGVCAVYGCGATSSRRAIPAQAAPAASTASENSAASE